MGCLERVWEIKEKTLKELVTLGYEERKYANSELVKHLPKNYYVCDLVVNCGNIRKELSSWENYGQKLANAFAEIICELQIKCS